MIKYVGKEIRMEQNIGLREFARKTNIAPSTISKWEHGDSVPKLPQLFVAASFFGVGIEALFQDLKE